MSFELEQVPELSSFQPLWDRLLETPSNDMYLFCCGFALGVDVNRGQADPLQALFSIMDHENQVENLIIQVSKYSFRRLPSHQLIFRETDCSTVLWKLYLQSRCQFLFTSVWKSLMIKESNKKIEKLSDGIELVKQFFSKLCDSVESFPPEVRLLFRKGYEELKERFSDQDDGFLRRTLITSTLVLNYICPKLVTFATACSNNAMGVPAHRKEVLQKNLIAVAKLLELVALGNTENVTEDDVLVNFFVKFQQAKFLSFCENLTDFKEYSSFGVCQTSKSISRSNSQPSSLNQAQSKSNIALYRSSSARKMMEPEHLAHILNVIYNYANDNMGDMCFSFNNLENEQNEREEAPDDQLWTFFTTVFAKLPFPENKDAFGPYAEQGRMECELSCRNDSPRNELAMAFKGTIDQVTRLINLNKQKKIVKSKDIESTFQILAQASSDRKFEPGLIPIPFSYNIKQFASSLDWLKKETAVHTFTVLLYFRGLWCAWCRSYMKSWNEFVPLISALGGAVFAVSTESPKKQAEKTKQFDMKLLNDHSLELANFYGVETCAFPGYKKNLTQPAVMVFSANGDLEYFWKSHPALSNFMGARDRVPARIIMAHICKTYPDLVEKKKKIAQKNM